MAKYEKAAQRTRTKLRETFWQLYEEKPIEKISVREIIEKAHYNRSTFYEYYSDIYAVLEEIEEELFAGLFGSANELVLDYGMSMDEQIYDIAQKYRKYQKYLKTLMGQNGDPQFFAKIKERLKATFRPLVSATQIIAFPNVDYFMEYFSNGLIGMLMYWQQMDRRRSIEDFLKTCKEVILPEGILPNFPDGIVSVCGNQEALAETVE